jgi:hypothetical protein
MHSRVVREAEKFDIDVDLPSWMSTLSINEKAVPYSE